MLFWSQSITSPRPPTAPQWAAVRIKAYIGDIRNPIGVIPVVQSFDHRHLHDGLLI